MTDFVDGLWKIHDQYISLFTGGHFLCNIFYKLLLVCFGTRVGGGRVCCFCLHGSLCGLSLYVPLVCSIYMSEILVCIVLCYVFLTLLVHWADISTSPVTWSHASIQRYNEDDMQYWAIFVSSSFNAFGLILYGPAALFGLSVCKSLSIPFSEMMRSGAVEKDCPISHLSRNSSWPYWQLSEKADWNCRFRMVAWSMGLEWRIPFSRSGATPLLSVL